MAKGLIIIYIGDGKGKTTAATGLAVRAAGAEKKVAFTQFMKGEWPSGELDSMKQINNIDVNIFGKGFVGIQGDQKSLSEHRQEAEKALKFAREQMKSGKYDLVVLDEFISGIEEGAITLQDAVDLIKSKPQSLHLCLTGHRDFKELIDLADLVTEMKMIKHPYYEGILAQQGIDY